MAVRLALPGPARRGRGGRARGGRRRRRRARRRRRPLAALLDAHHYTDGLAFLAAGTPTNNTGAERAGYASRDRRGERASRSSGPSPPRRRPELGAGQRRRPPRRRPRVGRASGSRRRSGASPAPARATSSLAEAMQTALWPATWGYYLTQFTRSTTPRASWVARPRPSLPAPGRCAAGAALRSPALRRAAGHVARRLVGHRRRRRTQRPPRQLLGALRDQVWRPATVGAATGRAQRRSRRRPRRRAARRARQRRLPRAPRARSALPARTCAASSARTSTRSASSPACASSRRTCPHRVGLPGAVGLDLFVYEDASSPLGVALARDADGTLAYIAALLAADPDTASPRRCPTRPSRCCRRCCGTPCCASTPRPRRGCSPAAGATAGRAARRRRAGRPRARSPGPTADAGPGSAASRCPVPPTARTVGGHLGALDRLHRPRGPPLGELRAALRTLGAADPAAVERLLPAALDATSYRLDAWVTSLADATAGRAARRRSRRAAWSAATAGSRSCGPSRDPRSPSCPPTSPARCWLAADDPGFIHAPSLNQASTAALLRNAHLAHGGARDSPYADQADLGPGAPGRAALRRRAAGASRSVCCSATTSSGACTRCRSTS